MKWTIVQVVPAIFENTVILNGDCEQSTELARVL